METSKRKTKKGRKKTKMKNQKEYKKRLENAEDFKGCYLEQWEKTELRQDIKNAAGIVLKEFNNKATIKTTKTGLILQSYYTDVCEIKNGDFIKLWDGFSVTTLNHINAFRKMAGLKAISKYEWVMMDI